MEEDEKADNYLLTNYKFGLLKTVSQLPSLSNTSMSSIPPSSPYTVESHLDVHPGRELIADCSVETMSIGSYISDGQPQWSQQRGQLLSLLLASIGQSYFSGLTLRYPLCSFPLQLCLLSLRERNDFTVCDVRVIWPSESLHTHTHTAIHCSPQGIEE